MINDVIARDLDEKGWSVQAGYFMPGLATVLQDDLRAMAAQMKKAAIGRADTHQDNAQVRTDSTLWLTGETPAQKQFLAQMDGLRGDLNRALFMGLFDYEAHYALYEAGGFYRKHVDAFQGQKNRIVSTVTYLTPDWAEGDEGHLVLYDPQDQEREIARVLPQAGTLAIFLSAEIPHEVLPPARPRASIAGWFRCNPSTGGRVDPSR